MDVQTRRAQVAGWRAACAVAGTVTAAFVSSCAKEPHPQGAPQENRSEESSLVGPPPTLDVYVHTDGGGVTVRAQDALLENVLVEIAEHSGLQLIVEHRLEERVTAELHSLPLTVALRELLRDRSFVLMESNTIESAREVRGTLWILSNSPSQNSVSALLTSSPREQQSNTLDELDDIDELRSALSDDDPNARMDAVWSLGDIDDEQAALMLEGIASQDAQPSVRAEAMYALASHPATPDNLVFARALTDADREVRRAAISALERIGTDRAVRTLAIALKDRDASIRATAVDALGEIGGEAARGLLESAMKDESALVREAAAAQLQPISSTG